MNETKQAVGGYRSMDRWIDGSMERSMDIDIDGSIDRSMGGYFLGDRDRDHLGFRTRADGRPTTTKPDDDACTHTCLTGREP